MLVLRCLLLTTQYNKKQRTEGPQNEECSVQKMVDIEEIDKYEMDRGTMVEIEQEIEIEAEIEADIGRLNKNWMDDVLVQEST